MLDTRDEERSLFTLEKVRRENIKPESERIKLMEEICL